MAHEIDTTVNANGAAIFAREPAWHGLGTVLDHAFTSAEALALAGLDFTVEKRALRAEGIDGDLKEFVATVRTDTNKALGVVGPKYHVLQNRDAFAAFDVVLKEHGAVYETAGLLRGGKQIFIAAKLPETFKVTDAPGDAIEEYLLAFNAHDGSGAIWMLPTHVRPVCANTVGAAVGIGFSVAKEKLARKRALRVLHTKNAEQRMKSASEIFEAAHKRTLATVENARRLAAMPATTEMMTAAPDVALDEFGPADPGVKAGERASGRVLLDAIIGKQERRDEKRDVIGQAIIEMITAEYALVGKTAWGLYNGIIEYADHGLRYKGKHAVENRFTSITGGRVDDFKGEVLTAILAADAGAKAA